MTATIAYRFSGKKSDVMRATSAMRKGWSSVLGKPINGITLEAFKIMESKRRRRMNTKLFGKVVSLPVKPWKPT